MNNTSVLVLTYSQGFSFTDLVIYINPVLFLDTHAVYIFIQRQFSRIVYKEGGGGDGGESIPLTGSELDMM